MNAPETLHTDRLTLRRPRLEDAGAIFSRYASDPEVTRYLSWATHKTIEDSKAFVAFADSEWIRNGIGPYQVFRKSDELLIGSTGLMLETTERASLGYCVSRDMWGQGFATEITLAMVELAQQLNVVRLYALCHPEHKASRRVLEKCGFEFEGALRKYLRFSNLKVALPSDVVSYSMILK